PGAENHFAASCYVPMRMARTPRVPNADRPLLREQNGDCLGPGADLDVAILGDGSRECASRADAPALVDITLIITDPALTGAIVIGIARQSEAVGSLKEGITQRVPPIAVGDRKRTIRPAILRVVRSQSPLGSFEVRNYGGIVPSPIAASGPPVEVLPITSVVNHPVDGSRTAQRFSLRHRDRTVCRRRIWLCLELPSVFRTGRRLVNSGRNVKQYASVGRPGFQQANRATSVGRQTIGQHASGGARADDDVIECVRRDRHQIPLRWTRRMSAVGYPSLGASVLLHRSTFRRAGAGHYPVRPAKENCELCGSWSRNLAADAAQDEVEENPAGFQR